MDLQKNLGQKSPMGVKIKPPKPWVWGVWPKKGVGGVKPPQTPPVGMYANMTYGMFMKIQSSKNRNSILNIISFEMCGSNHQ